ncbi:MAG: NAD(P)/FAD-dependent oxidoreductase [Candidatus Thermoplasmatota archaeon]
MSTIQCDVLVVGGGIAGSTCATVLDKLGVHDVHLIEKSKKIGQSHSQKIDFAEDKGLKKLLTKYNLPILKETNISRWFSPNQNMFELRSNIHDIWFKRGDSNSYENSVLKKSNVNIVIDTKVISINNNCVTVVNQSTQEKMTYEPRTIVIATGSHPPFFSNDKKENIIQTMHTKGFIFDKIDIDPDVPHIFFDNTLFPGSYLYMVQHSEENTGYFAYGTTAENNFGLEDFKKKNVIGKAISKSKIKKHIHGDLYVAKPCSLSQDNMLFIGDAANLMDPFLSYGVTNAIKSGVFAAEAIASGKDIHEEYKLSVNQEIVTEFKRQFKMRQFLNKLENEDIDCIVKLFNNLNEEGNIEKLFDNLPKLTSRVTPLLLKDLRLIKILFKGIGCVI